MGNHKFKLEKESIGSPEIVNSEGLVINLEAFESNAPHLYFIECPKCSKKWSYREYDPNTATCFDGKSVSERTEIIDFNLNIFIFVNSCNCRGVLNVNIIYDDLLVEANSNIVDINTY